jgi:hypothetical protein
MYMINAEKSKEQLTTKREDHPISTFNDFNLKSM